MLVCVLLDVIVLAVFWGSEMQATVARGHGMHKGASTTNSNNARRDVIPERSAALRTRLNYGVVPQGAALWIAVSAAPVRLRNKAASRPHRRGVADLRTINNQFRTLRFGGAKDHRKSPRYTKRTAAKATGIRVLLRKQKQDRNSASC
jgi:hypothetical protein